MESRLGEAHEKDHGELPMGIVAAVFESLSGTARDRELAAIVAGLLALRKGKEWEGER